MDSRCLARRHAPTAGKFAKLNGCASDKFVLHLKECALATKSQAVDKHEDLLALVKKNISLREIFLKRLVKHQVFQLRFV